MTIEKIYLAGGCFWGTEHYMKEVPGVVSTRVGYAVGEDGKSVATDPQYVTYRNVCGGNGHAETVEVVYDSDVTNLHSILEEFAYTIDPTLRNRQGPDVGVQYRTGIYYLKEDFPEHGEIIRNFLNELQNDYDRRIVTECFPLLQFVEAEEYHQKYLVKNRNGYCHINFADIARKKSEKERCL